MLWVGECRILNFCVGIITTATLGLESEHPEQQ